MQNNTDSEISDVTVTFPGDDSENIGSIPAGESKTRSDNEWNVSEDMLDTDLTFSAAFTDAHGNTPVSYTHLDVYKRQNRCSSSRSVIGIRSMRLSGNILIEKEKYDGKSTIYLPEMRLYAI